MIEREEREEGKRIDTALLSPLRALLLFVPLVLGVSGGSHLSLTLTHSSSSFDLPASSEAHSVDNFSPVRILK